MSHHDDMMRSAYQAYGAQNSDRLIRRERLITWLIVGGIVAFIAVRLGPRLLPGVTLPDLGSLINVTGVIAVTLAVTVTLVTLGAIIRWLRRGFWI